MGIAEIELVKIIINRLSDEKLANLIADNAYKNHSELIDLKVNNDFPVEVTVAEFFAVIENQKPFNPGLQVINNRMAALRKRKNVLYDFLILKGIKVSNPYLRAKPQSTLKLVQKNNTQSKKSIQPHFYFAMAASVILSIVMFSALALLVKKEISYQSNNSDPFINKLNTDCTAQRFAEYKLIDKYIDSHLDHLSKNITYSPDQDVDIIKAEELSDGLTYSLRDRYPQALVAYYRTINSESAKDLIYVRSVINDVENTPSGDFYSANLDRISVATRVADQRKADIEILRANTLRAKLLTKLMRIDEALPLAESNIALCSKAQYKYPKMQNFIWKGEAKSIGLHTNESIDAFKDAFDLACQIGSDKAKCHALMFLAGTNCQLNNDPEVIKYAEIGLSLENIPTNYSIQLLNWLSISKFRLGEKSFAIKLNEEAISKSTGKYKTYKLLSLCISAIMFSEERDFKKADIYFDQATSALAEVKDEAYRIKYASMINGFLGRSLGLRGDYEKAVSYYKQSIEQSEKSGEGPDLFMAQLRDGYSYCLEKTGQTDIAMKEKNLAIALYSEAKARSENSSDFFTYSISGLAQLETNEKILPSHK